MSKRIVIDFLVYVVVRTLICVVQSLSIDTCAWFARRLAWLFCDVLKIRGKVVHANLAMVFPGKSDAERRRIARGMWEHLFIMVCEIAQTPRKIHDSNWRRYVAMKGKPEIVRQLLDERPVVVVSGHFGNFDAGCYLIGLLGFPTYTVARRLDNPFLDRYLRAFREAKGQYIIEKEGSAPLIASILERRGKILLLGDQHAGPKGCWVDFLGHPASCHKAVALFTLMSRAPMLVVSNRRAGEPLAFQVTFEGVADPETLPPGLASVKALTRWYNQCLETAVLEEPEQYWWLHRRWRDPPPRRQSTAKGEPTVTAPVASSPASDQRHDSHESSREAA